MSLINSNLPQPPHSAVLPMLATKQNAPATQAEQVYTKLFQESIFGPYSDIPERSQDNQLSHITKYGSEVCIPAKTIINSEQLEKGFGTWYTRQERYFRQHPNVTAALILKIADGFFDQRYGPKQIAFEGNTVQEILPLFIVERIDITKEDWDQRLPPEFTNLIQKGKSTDIRNNVWEVIDPRTPTFPQNTDISIPPEPTKNLTVTPKNNCCVTS